MAENCFWRAGQKVSFYCLDQSDPELRPDIALPSGYNFLGIAASDDIVVVVADNGYVFTNNITLTDDWTERTTPLTGDSDAPLNIAYDGIRFSIAGSWNASAKTLYSADGITWSQGSDIPAAGGMGGYWQDISAKPGGGFIICGSDCVGEGDGTAFSSEDAPAYRYWDSVAVKGGTHVCTAYTNNSRHIVDSGSGWSEEFNGFNQNWQGVVANSNVFIAYTTTGVAMRSATGLTDADWESITITGVGSSGVYTMEALSNDRLIAFGWDGSTVYSDDDGDTWSAGVDLGDHESIGQYASCAWGNRYYLIDVDTGDGGRAGAFA